MTHLSETRDRWMISPKAIRTRTLAFRDYLRDHLQAARQYEHLKHRLASRHSAATFAALQAYADAKTEFVTGITERALTEGYPRDF